MDLEYIEKVKKRFSSRPLYTILLLSAVVIGVAIVSFFAKVGEHASDLLLGVNELSPSAEVSQKEYILPIDKGLWGKAFNPQLEPVLDRTLLFGIYMHSVILGGVNLPKVSLAVRSASGERVDVTYNAHNKWLVVYYGRNPYFEIEYRGKYYSIAVTPIVTPYPYEKDFIARYTIRAIDEPTMDLIKASALMQDTK